MADQMLPPEELPETPNADVVAQRPSMKVCRDLFEGTDAIKKEASTYLPKFPGELDENYSVRKSMIALFNAFERTVLGLVGMIFRRDPVLGDDVPKSIAGDREKRNTGGDWENLDLAGTHGDVFVRERGVDGLVDGHACFLVDCPQVDTAATSRIGGLKLERDLGVRPYWVPITKSQIVSFRTAVEGGKQVITQLVLEFCNKEPKGAFGEETVMEYRVYRRTRLRKNSKPVITHETWQKRADDHQSHQVGETGTISNQTEIPFVVIYGPRKKGVLVSKPPLYDLAQRNLTYLRVEIDELISLHLAGTPHPVLEGSLIEEADKQKGGPSWMTIITKGSKLSYLEHAGNALQALAAKLKEVKAEMAVLGLAMLQRDFRAAETAESKRMDKSASDSALAVYARSLKDGVEQGLQFHANYRKEPSGGRVTICKDFDALTLDPTMIAQILALNVAGKIADETLWTILAQGELLPDDFDHEVEKSRLAKQHLPEPGEGGDPPKDGSVGAPKDEPAAQAA
jgi:hypothetical protein